MTRTPYAGHGPRVTRPQMEQARPDQVLNKAGGYVFQIGPWDRFLRFLILGTEGGTYYAAEQEITRDNYHNVLACIKSDGKRAVQLVEEISTSGRAPKNTPAIFALALCLSYGNVPAKWAAVRAVPKVCRIPTHLFQLLNYCKEHRGHGLVMRTAIQTWYQNAPAEQLALHMIKYRQREGWTHADVLREFKPRPPTDEHDLLFHYIAHPPDEVYPHNDGVHRGCRDPEWERKASLPPNVQAFMELRSASVADTGRAIRLITEHRLPRECLPTELLNDAKVWEALLADMPVTAMIRNLGKMTDVGLLSRTSGATQTVVERLNSERLRRGRVHPIQVLSAMATYAQGHGFRGKLSWTPVPQIIDALDAAFYESFGNLTPTGKRLVIGLDVSSSMTWGEIAGVPGLTPVMGEAAMCMIHARETIPPHYLAFTTTPSMMQITARQRLDDVQRLLQSRQFGGTDCALPMQWALANKIEADAFIVYTDNETWAGRGHPFQALQQYRQKTGINARLIVVAMTATECSIADPDDGGMLDVVGFDTAAPDLMAEFLGARLEAEPQRP